MQSEAGRSKASRQKDSSKEHATGLTFHGTLKPTFGARQKKGFFLSFIFGGSEAYPPHWPSGGSKGWKRRQG
jgi:hypothetical protein